MRRELAGISLIVFIMRTCNYVPQEGTYHLGGIVTNEKLEGRTIYLQDAVKGTVRYDSAMVSEGCSVFSGKMNAPEVRKLFIQGTDSDRFSITLPIALEPGEISTRVEDIVPVEGTRLNEEMMQTLTTIDRFKDRGFTGKEIREIKEASTGFVLEQIVKHISSSVGRYLYRAHRSKLNGKQQAEI